MQIAFHETVNKQFLLNSEQHRIMVQDTLVNDLRKIVSQKKPVSLFFGQYKRYFLSILIGIDEVRKRLILRCSENDTLNRRLLLTGRALAETRIDNTPFKFYVESITQEYVRGELVFTTPYPAELLKIKQRGYIRIPLQQAAAINCIVRDGNRYVRTRVMDISTVGAGLVALPNQHVIQADRRYHDCRIILPGDHVIALSLKLLRAEQFALDDDTCVQHYSGTFQDEKVLKYLMTAMRGRLVVSH